MKTLLKRAFVMCTIVTMTSSLLKAACSNGVCSMRRPAATVVKATRTYKAPSRRMVSRRTVKNQPRRGGCANGVCSR